jgi:hypothetical protein
MPCHLIIFITFTDGAMEMLLSSLRRGSSLQDIFFKPIFKMFALTDVDATLS